MKVVPAGNNQPMFKAKISPKFETFIRSYINHGANRLKNNYRLNQKIIQYQNFGYDDYTINLMNKSVGWGNEYVLIATKEGQDLKDGIFIKKNNSVKQIIESFLRLKKGEFNYHMKKNSKYSTSYNI